MKTLHRTEIGAHPILEDVQRAVRIMRFNMDGYSEFMEFNYEIDFSKAETLVLTQKEVKPWVITNRTTMFVRDEEFNKIPNPDYVPNENIDNSYDQYLKMPAFDYVWDLMMVKNIPLANLMTMYILEEAQDGFFNV